MRSEVRGVEVTIDGLAGFETRVKARMFVAVAKGLEKARTAVLAEITAGDHSLAVLRAMGHPYAAARPNPPHSDPVIHQQTGEYVRALRVHSPRASGGEIVEGCIAIDGDEKMRQLDRWLQQGTMSMIARPWARYVTERSGKEIRAAMIAELRAAIAERSK